MAVVAHARTAPHATSYYLGTGLPVLSAYFLCLTGYLSWRYL